jgi:hypothetical protein
MRQNGRHSPEEIDSIVMEHNAGISIIGKASEGKA